MEEGSEVWVKGGPEEWQEGTVTKATSQGAGVSIAVALKSGSQQTFTLPDADADLEDLKLRNIVGQGGCTVAEGADVEDLCDLTFLHEPAILYSLKARYAAGAIYTNTGLILLAVNPFKKMPLYTDALLKQYREHGEKRCFKPDYSGSMPPHVYALADMAYRNMSMPTTEFGMRNQSILVSGESGAGKTETCKIIMQYVAMLGTSGGASAELGHIENQVLQSNPILEAFGNARTVRNDNSSRFGKFIQLQFSTTGKLHGAAQQTFLLEKVRVVRQGPNERNYHIFYALCAGATPEQRAKFLLKTPRDYSYTNQSGCYDRRDGVSDEEVFFDLMKAFGTLGFPQDQWEEVFKVVSAVLALGNIEFEDIPGAGDADPKARPTDKSKAHMEDVANLLLGGGPEEAENASASLPARVQEIADALTSRKVTAGFKQHVIIYLTAEQAMEARDALAKAVYAALFGWIVHRTNESMAKNTGSAGAGGGDQLFIGLLDIFGFESFEHNFFEQLLINYANEMLQQEFNDFVFRQEQDEYKTEQIDWEDIDFPDNSDCLKLIEGNTNGILGILNTQCKVGQGSDQALANALYKTFDKNTRFSAPPRVKANNAFVVHHYAGSVTYSTKGMVDKNKDTLAQEGVDLLLNSESRFVRLLGDVEVKGVAAAMGASAGGGGGGGGGEALKPANTRRTFTTEPSKFGPSGQGTATRRSTIGAKSLGTQFRDSLKALTAVVKQTHPHYVRCIKPNDTLVPHEFNSSRVVQQLRNAGVLEVVRVARAGFPVRLGIDDFVTRFGLLARGALDDAYSHSLTMSGEEQQRAACEAVILSVLKQAGSDAGGDFGAACKENGLRMGITKVFMQQKAFNKIEKLLTAVMAKAAILAQAGFRRFRDRKRYKAMLRAASGAEEPVVEAREPEPDAPQLQAKLAELKSQFDAQLAVAAKEISALKAEVGALRTANDALRARPPARFVVASAALGPNAGAMAEVEAALNAALGNAGAQQPKTWVFEHAA